MKFHFYFLLLVLACASCSPTESVVVTNMTGKKILVTIENRSSTNTVSVKEGSSFSFSHLNIVRLSIKTDSGIKWHYSRDIDILNPYFSPFSTRGRACLGFGSPTITARANIKTNGLIVIEGFPDHSEFSVKPDTLMIKQ